MIPAYQAGDTVQQRGRLADPVLGVVDDVRPDLIAVRWMMSGEIDWVPPQDIVPVDVGPEPSPGARSSYL